MAVVWSLAFAWAARVQLPAWVPALLALVAWAVYIGDRLLDARAGLRTGQTARLRDRHHFHHRHRRVLAPLAVISACAAAWIVFSLMPPGARERNSVLAAAAVAYFSGVHSSRRLPRLVPPLLVPLLPPLLSKEFLAGLLFTAGCVLPALSRAAAGPGSTLWPLWTAAVYFAALAWLNCHAIERWESEATPPALEKRRVRSDFPEKHSSGANPPIDSAGFCVRAKALTYQSWPTAQTSFPFALLLAFAGVLLAPVLRSNQPRTAALVGAAAASALLLALLDRLRSRLTPLALRVAADLVLLTPLALYFR